MTLRYSAFTRTTLISAAAVCLAVPALSQTAPQLKERPKPVDPNAPPDRSSAYYHDGLAHLYEELAVNNGRPDYAAQAVEEYKLALNADPNSQYLQDGLADLYFKIGRIREAVTAAQDQAKKNPDDIAAHTLLGKVYLRSLGDMQGAQSAEMLQLAIGEYQTLARLKPKDLETHLLLGQLYGLNHDTAKAAAEFKIAQSLDSNSEEAVLNMARLYSEQGEAQQAIDALSAVPADDRSARIDFALGASYDQIHKSKEAIAAYKAALDQEPDNPDTMRALAAALLADNQLDQALPLYKQLAVNDPTDVESQLKVSEIQQHQGHYDDALATLNKAKASNANQENQELSFNEAQVYDSLGRYDEAIAALKSVLAIPAQSPDGKFTEPEKHNRVIFLDRLGTIAREANKTSEAVDAYKQIIDMGGDVAIRGYQGEIDAYRDAHEWKEAAAAAGEAAKANPGNPNIQLLYAFQLADTGEPDQALALAQAQLKGTPEKPLPADRDTLVTISNLELRLHRSADAQAYLDKADAFSIKPDDHAYIDLQRATIYDHDKQYDKAEAEYRKALAVDPTSGIYPTVLNDYGYMLADRGINLSEALKMIQKAVELDPQNGAFLDSLGWVYFKLGQYGPAEENLHKAIERQSGDPSIHDHLGQVYEKQGNLKLAVAQWERSMTEYAHSLPADADPVDVAKVKRKLDDARTKLAKLSTSTNKKS
jgi:tetratricopeptide (TPR) repeat protein